jgi:hypothetical protein
LFGRAPQLGCRALFPSVHVAFVAVTVDHRVGLVGQPLALGDAVPERLLIALQLPRLPIPARLTVLFIRDDRELLDGSTTDREG